MFQTAIHYTPKTRVLLGGSLARQFGREHWFALDRSNAQEVVKAIDANHPGFVRALAESKANGLVYAVFRNGKNIGEGELMMGGCQEIRVVPVIHGSKRAGVLQTVLGVALIALAWWNPLGWAAATTNLVMAAGVANAAGGVLQLLSPQAAGLSQSAAPENLPSYAFGSAKNTTASGNPVPICIGKRRWGGAIISASIYAEDKT
ncbi:tail assembly protein [Pseudomonas sp. AP-1]|uniref:tail assembly protein n=1 Tax=Pseudomonas sp. AP-1 TaxID=3231718 RepID=UPI0035AFD411